MGSVIVVGAGFAGLAAAERLLADGWEVTVFEARERVGGRVHSRRLENGAVVELGAEFVLPGHELLRATAERLGLALYEKGTLYGDREPRGGQPVTRDELAEAVRALPSLRGRSVEDALAGVASEGARAVLGARVAVSTGYELDDQPASVLAEGASSFGDFPSHGVAGGNQELAHALARAVGDRLHLGAPVERIDWSSHGVVVRAAGAELAADACVIAVPAPHTLELVLDPPLPGRKRAALEAVRYGRAAKLFLPLAEPAGPSATLSVPGRFWTYTQHAPDGSQLPVACSFAGSGSALARLRVDDGPSAWTEAVRGLRPNLTVADAAPTLSTWDDDPWARAAYSARSLASPLEDGLLALAVGPLAFAGEHTAGEWHALMEGALRSGVRAAGDVAAHARAHGQPVR
jgi:monoamine oxidase